MKIKYLILITIMSFFTGCEYTDSKTTTTNVSTKTGTLNVLHTNTNEQEVVVAGETFKSSSTLGVQSDGTAEGTKAILDFNFDTPTVKETVNLAYDNAINYTTEESKALFDKAATTSNLIAKTAQEEFNATLNYLKTTIK